MCCKKYVFEYEKRRFKYKSKDNSFTKTLIKQDIVIMDELENIKNWCDEKGIKFNYIVKPKTYHENEGKIIIKTEFSHYHTFKSVVNALGDVLTLKIR